MSLARKNAYIAQEYLYYSNSYNLAYKYALTALKQNNKDEEVLYTYASACYFCHKCKEALKYFELLLDSDLHKQEIYVYIAHCRSNLRDNLFLALNYINKAIAYYPMDRESQINTLVLKAEIQYRMNEKRVALKNFIKANEMGDQDKSLCYISKIYFELGDELKGMKYLRKILQLDKNTKSELYKKFEHLDYHEMKQILIILLNRYELDDFKIEMDEDVVNRMSYLFS